VLVWNVSTASTQLPGIVSLTIAIAWSVAVTSKRKGPGCSDGRPGIWVIAERFGVNPSTVQRISRPFEGASVAVA
jgi:hypothetical protein